MKAPRRAETRDSRGNGSFWRWGWGLFLPALILAGCAKKKVPATRGTTDGVAKAPAADVILTAPLQAGPSTATVVIVEDSWLERTQRKERLLEELEARADNPNDPFALSTEAIRELEQSEMLFLQ